MTRDPLDISAISDKVAGNVRLSMEEGLFLYEHADLLSLGRLAEIVRFQKHPDERVTFVVDRNINYTNICVSGCRFCAFYKKPDSGRGYVLSREDLHAKIRETLDLGGTQILLQGGMNPHLSLSYYLDLLFDIKAHFDIHIHGFSPPEIVFFSEQFNLSVREIVSRFKAAGLDSIPGGGAEILCDDIRKQVSPGKCLTGPWLEVMETAHSLGMRSSATMMFGHVETPAHLFRHMEAIRSLQDRTGGFTAFIPWTFQPDNTRIQRSRTSAAVYLKVLALSRLYLDNIDNIQASWVTQGDKIAQTALFYGANDMGSTMIEENVVASAGVDFMLPESELRRLIQTAGFEPRRRDCYYNLL